MLRVLNFIKTNKEKEIGIGEEYPFGPLEVGECYLKAGWAFHREILIFKFKYDFKDLALQYNEAVDKIY